MSESPGKLPSVPLPKRAWYRGRLLLPALLVTALLTGGIVAYRERAVVLTAAGSWLDVGERLRQPVDSVFILGGDSDTRPFAAAALIRSGWARQALIVPTARERDGSSHQELLREILAHRGIAAEDIVELPGQVASTRDEARALRQFLERHPGHTVAVITSDYHTRRARAIFTAQLADCAGRVHFVAAPTERFTAANWWQYEQGWKMYVGEYVKLVSNLCQPSGG
jgi:uncharacterized SAM-binding protein YcdF (DUF218 family)